MKKFFILFISLISAAAQASEKKLPFVFLNQYFEYDVSEGNSYNIGGVKIEWNDNLARIVGDELVITPQAILLEEKWKIYTRDIANKIIFSADKVDFNKTTTFKLPQGKAEASVRICFSSRNRITQYLMCKNLKNDSAVSLSSNPDLYPQVFISKKLASRFGRVILNQPKKSILFDLKISQNEFIKMTTRKRRIIPSTVRKNIESESYQIKFVDIDWDNFSWETNVGFDQEAFEIPNDGFVNVYQDYFNKDYSKKELELTYFEPPYKRMRILNMYAFSPYFGFSKFDGNTRTKNISVLTEYDISFRTYLLKQMPKDRLKWLSKYFQYWTASANFRSVKYISSVDDVTINNSGAFLYNLSASLNRGFSERISYGYRVAIEKNTALAYESAVASEVSMTSVLNKELGMQGSLNVFDHGRIVSFLHAGFAFLAPVNVSGASTKVGLRTYFRTDLHYADGNKLYGVGFHYNLRQQESALQKFNDQTFDYTASYSVAF